MPESTPLQYRDLWYGEETFETNEVFSNRHIDDRSKFERLIESKNLKIVSKENITKSISRYKLKREEKEEFFVVYSPLTHSGDKNNRLRSHIPPEVINNGSLKFKTYLVGAYNAGDVVVYVFGDITDFINKSESKNYNTSFWIGDVDKLFEIYKHGDSFWYRNKEDVLLLGATSETIKNIDSEVFINRYFYTKGVISEEEDVEVLTEEEQELRKLLEMIDKTPIRIDESFFTENSRMMLKRNKEYRRAALLRAGYKCEICGKTSTFKTKNGDEYFDGHHLIMYNPTSQSRFEYCLDIPMNIICLCPECHKKIHFAKDEEVKDMLIKLFLKHKEILKNFEIESLDDIISDYITYREEEI